MRAIDIFKGQVYQTKMIGRFHGDNSPLGNIKILAHVEGFVIFVRDGVRQAVTTKDFKSTYLTACRYTLKKKVSYQLSDTLPIKLVKIKP